MNNTQNPETTVRTYDVTLYMRNGLLQDWYQTLKTTRLNYLKSFFNLKLLFFIRIKIHLLYDRAILTLGTY